MKYETHLRHKVSYRSNGKKKIAILTYDYQKAVSCFTKWVRKNKSTTLEKMQ